jgi:hypothetical protein
MMKMFGLTLKIMLLKFEQKHQDGDIFRLGHVNPFIISGNKWNTIAENLYTLHLMVNRVICEKKIGPSTPAQIKVSMNFTHFRD